MSNGIKLRKLYKDKKRLQDTTRVHRAKIPLNRDHINVILHMNRKNADGCKIFTFISTQ